MINIITEIAALQWTAFCNKNYVDKFINCIQIAFELQTIPERLRLLHNQLDFKVSIGQLQEFGWYTFIGIVKRLCT